VTIDLGIKGGAGASVPHDSAPGHVTGAARFIDDLPEPRDLLHAWIVTSPHAHARLLSIDTSGLPAGAFVAIATDIPGHNDMATGIGVEPLLATDEVHYFGQPVAIVAAPTREEARKAAETIKVVYEELPAILTIDEALAKDSRVADTMRLRRGDPEAAIATAPVAFKGEVRLGGQEHFYLESQIALAEPGEDGQVKIHSSTQHPSEVQHHAAHVLGLPMSSVTVEVRRMGGGFGGKESQGAHFGVLAALLAGKTGRPVKLRPSRDDDMIITGKRHPYLLRYEAGVDATGRVLGVKFLLASDAGWSADLSPGVMSRALCHVDNTYFLPAVEALGVMCRTNHCSQTAFRGFGGPQGVAVVEALMDDIAARLGLDPLEVRRRNLYGPTTGLVTPYGQEVEEPLTDRVLSELLSFSDYERRKAEIEAHNATNPILRRGVALTPLKFGLSFNLMSLNQAGALVHVYPDGSVFLSHGGTEMGQGLHTKVAQLVARVFGIDLEGVRISATVTDKVPNTSPTAASTGSDLNGKAAENAALILRGRLADYVAKLAGRKPEEVTFAANRVRAGDFDKSFAEAARDAQAARVQLSAAGFYATPKIHFDRATMSGRPFLYFVYGAAVSEVLVDTLTGETRVVRADILEDAGDSINPAIDKGQVEGAFVQGLGWMLTEELVWDAKGRFITHAPSTYKIPTSRDVPPVFNVRLLENAPNREDTVFRSKGIGEPPLLLALSVWFAVRHAVAGLYPVGKMPELNAPATPEAVMRAMEGSRRG